MTVDSVVQFDKASSSSKHGVTDNATVDWVEREFQKSLDFFQMDRERENNAWRMFSGFDHGQWSAEAVKRLTSEKRHISQYNIIRNKIESLAGYFLNNSFDIDFVPVDGRYSDLTQLLKKIFYSDREMMNWNQSYMQFVTDYLIHSGTEEMVISTKYSPFGNIGFERVTPGHLLRDPHWTSQDCKELNLAWKVTYLDAQQIKDRYEVDEEYVDAQINLLNITGQQYIGMDHERGYIPYYNLDTSYGSKWRVIEQHEMRKEKKEIEVVCDAQGNVTEVPEGDDDFKRQWAILNQIDFTSGVISKKIYVNNYYRTSICRSLLPSIVLEEVKPIIQIGRLPFFCASSARINGRDSGIVEILSDIQKTINKRESLIDAMITNSASGAKMIDPQLVGNDAQKMEELRANFNNPSYTGFSKSGEIANGNKRHVEEFPRTQFPQDVINELNRMLDLADRIGKTPAAWDARSESSNINGILYARMSKQAEVNATVQLMGLENHWHDKGEAYVLLSKDLYANVFREFKEAGTREDRAEPIKLNDIQVDESGRPITLNDISKLPRHKVIVAQSPQGVNNREVDREINTELLRVIPGQNPVSRALTVKNIMRTLPTSTKERKEFEEAASIEFDLAKASAESQILQFEAAKMQAAMQIQASQNPPQQQPDQQGEPQQGGEQQAQQPQPQPIKEVRA